MANLRIIFDNAADRATTVASTTAGALVAANLKTDVKSEIWRATGTSATLTLTWTNSEIVGGVAIPFCNFTSTSTLRVQGYTNASDPTPVFDTGVQLAAASTFNGFAFGLLPLGVNAYAYGAGTYASLWFTPTAVKKVIITIDDSANSQGYVEAARLVVGTYWSPENNCEYGAEVGAADMTRNSRSDAGDLKTDRGPKYKTLSLDLTLMPKADRNTLWRIVYGNGLALPVYISLLPADTDGEGEQIFQLYGKLTKSAAIKFQFLNQFNSHLELEEI